MAGEPSGAVMLSKPAAGQTRQVGVEPGCRYSLDFDPSAALFDSRDGTLSVEFDDGATLLLDNFFSAVAREDIRFSLPDGLEVSGRDIAESLYMVLKDFETHQGNGEEETAAVAPAPVPVDHFEAVMEEGGSIGPVCHTVCALPSPPEPGPEGQGPEPRQTSEYVIAPRPAADSAEPGIGAHEGSLLGRADGGGAADSFPGAVPASDIVERHAPLSSVLLSPQDAAGESLLLEDLLDTTLPQTFTSEYASPAFESLLSTSQLPDTLQGRAVPVNESDCLSPSPALPESADDGPDDVLIAFLQMGSF